MGLARVWNDHTLDYKEKFRDDEIIIPAKKYVEMDKSEAIIFMGQYTKIEKLDNGEVKNPKMLRLEIIKDDVAEKIVCQMCKEEFQTKKELALHSELKHAGDILEDDGKKPKRHAAHN